MKYTHTHSEYSNERKMLWVVIITALTMVTEITFGYWTNSMALLADGWHMATHTLALSLAWIAYFVSRKYAQNDKISFDKDKLLSLSGFTSAILLLVIAVFMAIESVDRMINPVKIMFSQAIIIAIIGLIINVICAFVLGYNQGDKQDYNIRSAYLHVLADALTSVAAIIALVCGMLWKIYWLDALSGIISSVIITKWSIGLIFNSGKSLINFHKNN